MEVKTIEELSELFFYCNHHNIYYNKATSCPLCSMDNIIRTFLVNMERTIGG